MKIVVVSDSHGRNEILKTIQKENPDASLFLHCGDLEGDPMDYPGYIFVRGNNDYFGDFVNERVIPCMNHKIYLTHSHRCSYFSRTEDLIRRAKQLDCDIVCFGHTHVSFYDVIDGITLVNPGSLSHSRDSRPCSYAILDVETDKVDVDFKFQKGSQYV